MVHKVKLPGVYISIPFCAQKCTFCNFASDVFPQELLQDYLAALEAELAAAHWDASPDTLYLGGGTPSLLDPTALERLLTLLPSPPSTIHHPPPTIHHQPSTIHHPPPTREATIEAAPGTVTPERAAHWRRLGLDRVSLGAQSFAPRELAAVGRKHTPDVVAAEVALLRRTGIDNINLDLIAGLPHQTRDTWRLSLDWIARLDPPHVSVYMFEADHESRLGREIEAGGSRYGAGALPDDALTAQLYQDAVERLRALGILRYEISNFARPGFESRHNLKYWRREPYRGFGADAHSCDGRRRWGNVKTAREYVERFRAGQSPVEQVEELGEREARQERFFLGLRQTAGVEFEPQDWQFFAAPIRRLLDDGLLARQGGLLRLTDRGVLFSNEVFQEFL